MREDFDKLAELFMTDSNVGSAEGLPRESIVEILIPGVLPPGGHVWFAPYASALSETAGCVGFITLTSTKVEIEVFGEKIGSSYPREADLKVLLPFLATRVNHWLIAPSSDINLEKIITIRPDRITVLGEAHSAALEKVVEIIDSAAEFAALSRMVLPRVGIAFLGSQNLEAQEAIENVERAVGDALGVPVEFRGSLPKLIVPNKPIFTKQVPAAEKFEQIIELILCPTTGVDGLVAGITNINKQKDIEFFRSISSNSSSSKVVMGAPVEPSNLLQNIKDTFPIEMNTSLPTGIELGVDEEGQLHLIGTIEKFKELVAAESWVVKNIELISKSIKKPVAIERGPCLHLVTNNPLLVTALYDSSIFLHLAVSVQVEGKSTIYRTPLNNPLEKI